MRTAVARLLRRLADWLDPVQLTDDERKRLMEQPRCLHCGGWHLRACPRVASLEFEGETLKRVTYWHRWDDHAVLYPDELA